MSRAVLVVCLACLALSGCLYKTAYRQNIDSRSETGDPRLIGSELAGTAEVDEEGNIHLDLTMRGRCEQSVTTYGQVVTTKTKHTGYLIGNLLGSLYGAVGAGAGGILLLVNDYDEGAILIGAGVVLVGNLFRVGLSKRTKTRIESTKLGEKTQPAPCGDALAGRALDRTPRNVVLTTPWGATLEAPVKSRVAAFPIDWRQSGIDPLDGDASAALRRPWRFTSDDEAATPGAIEWRPDASQSEAMLVAIGRATGTDTTAAAGEAPPLLEIEDLDTKGPLPAGKPARTALTIANRGRGNAYRVVATTKSSDPALHGLRYSFGKIGPGESITKYAEVTVPREHEDGKALVVVTVSEANNNIPDRFSKEVSIVHSGRPRLDVTCEVMQGSANVTETAVVDAGRQLRVRCTVRNNGDGPATAAHVEARLASGKAKPSNSSDIEQGRSGTFDVLLVVPTNARTGQSLVLSVDARETNFNDTARWRLPLEVGLMQICQPPISRTAYERKLAELRDLGLDRATLKAYQEQLVACLGD